MIRVLDATQDETPIITARKTYISLQENKFRRDIEQQQKEQELAELKEALKSFAIPFAFIIIGLVAAYFLTK